MKFDPRVPKRLVEVQEWFGATITKPMQEELACDAASFVAPSATLSSEERMQIYNQSYWLRLLTALQEEYPFVTRLFGKDGFDEKIGCPYLRAHPPAHWSLNLLGRELVQWLESAYKEDDLLLVHLAATIDWACQHCFFAKKKRLPPLNETLLSLPLALQPDLCLIEAYGHFMNFRAAFLKEEPEYWEENEFPPLQKDRSYYFAIFRNAKLTIQWDELELEEYSMLRLIQQGLTIEEAAERVQELPGMDLKLIEEEVASWLQKWLLMQWLSI